MINSRRELIELCERGVVPVDRWLNRDSADAQKKLGTALTLLRAGCVYRSADDPGDTTNTIWIRTAYPGFHAFEYGRDEKTTWDDDLFYLPTGTTRTIRRVGLVLTKTTTHQPQRSPRTSKEHP